MLRPCQSMIKYNGAQLEIPWLIYCEFPEILHNLITIETTRHSSHSFPILSISTTSNFQQRILLELYQVKGREGSLVSISSRDGIMIWLLSPPPLPPASLLSPPSEGGNSSFSIL